MSQLYVDTLPDVDDSDTDMDKSSELQAAVHCDDEKHVHGTKLIKYVMNISLKLKTFNGDNCLLGCPDDGGS